MGRVPFTMLSTVLIPRLCFGCGPHAPGFVGPAPFLTFVPSLESLALEPQLYRKEGSQGAGSVRLPGL
jgi:hypothetical protein